MSYNIFSHTSVDFLSSYNNFSNAKSRKDCFLSSQELLYNENNLFNTLIAVDLLIMSVYMRISGKQLSNVGLPTIKISAHLNQSLSEHLFHFSFPHKRIHM